MFEEVALMEESWFGNEVFKDLLVQTLVFCYEGVVNWKLFFLNRSYGVAKGVVCHRHERVTAEHISHDIGFAREILDGVIEFLQSEAPTAEAV